MSGYTLLALQNIFACSQFSLLNVLQLCLAVKTHSELNSQKSSNSAALYLPVIKKNKPTPKQPSEFL